MTKAETERLAKLEQKVDDIQADVQEIKELLKAQEGRFVTQAFLKWAAGFLLSLAVAGIAFANWVKNQ